MKRESTEYRCVKARRLAESGEDSALVVLVGDTEARLEPHVMTVRSQQFGAKRVDGAALYQLDLRIKVVEPGSNFFRRLVGEGEGVDALRVHPEAPDEESDPFDEAIRFPRAWAGQDERRSERRFDCRAL
jgi:hypothetical protein